ncbi:MAG TPA: hypothetical protein VGS22_13565 [Thermoanaerobaculia bacterium]|jgi:hypothetical protein|nr:hypothetical protein [Thermoanaerobaculia bacterium]
MKTRLLLLAVSLLALVGASNLAAAEGASGAPVAALTVASSSLPGCANAKAAGGLFNPAPIDLAYGTCGACSLDGCSGRNVGSACWTRFIGWAWCIPAETNFCPTGPQNTTNWACSCATEYL